MRTRTAASPKRQPRQDAGAREPPPRRKPYPLAGSLTTWRKDMQGKFISYLRVSTTKQGADGLGIAAQRHAVEQYLNGGRWTLVAEFVEVESGKDHKNRPKLEEALNLCKLTKAKLIVAK